ncbi:hypothetical protein D3C71_2010990 [compost metagenome]
MIRQPDIDGIDLIIQQHLGVIIIYPRDGELVLQRQQFFPMVRLGTDGLQGNGRDLLNKT